MKECYKVLFYLTAGMLSFLWLVKVPILEKYISQQVGTKVSFHWISIWPSSVKIHDLDIQNILKAKEVRVQCHWTYWLQSPIVIEKLGFDHVTLLSHPSETKTLTPQGRPFIIRECVLNEIAEEGESFVEKRVVLHDLQSEEGFPLQEMLREIERAQKVSFLSP
jgi:hypothetical protein